MSVILRAPARAEGAVLLVSEVLWMDGPATTWDDEGVGLAVTIGQSQLRGLEALIGLGETAIGVLAHNGLSSQFDFIRTSWVDQICTFFAVDVPTEEELERPGDFGRVFGETAGNRWGVGRPGLLGAFDAPVPYLKSIRLLANSSGVTWSLRLLHEDHTSEFETQDLTLEDLRVLGRYFADGAWPAQGDNSFYTIEPTLPAASAAPVRPRGRLFRPSDD